MPRCARALVVLALVGVSVLASQATPTKHTADVGGPTASAVVATPTPPSTSQPSTPSSQTGQH